MKKQTTLEFVHPFPRQSRWKGFGYLVFWLVLVAAGFMLPFLVGCGPEELERDPRVAPCVEWSKKIAAGEGCAFRWSACMGDDRGVKCTFGMDCGGTDKTAVNYCYEAVAE